MSRLSIALALVAFLALPGAARAGEKYALVVGVNDYLPTELPSLSYAEADARRMTQALKRLGFQVTTMSARAEEERLSDLSAEAILRQARMLFADKAPDDTLVFVFAGHGVRFRGDDAIYVCPGPARLTDRGTLLPVARLLGLAEACPAGRKLLLLDVGLGEVRVADRGSDTLDPPPAGVEPVAGAPTNEGRPAVALDPRRVVSRRPPVPTVPRRTPPGTVAVFGCQPDEWSFEVAGIGGSIFLHHTLLFLEGQAPPDSYPDGKVSLARLIPFVQEATTQTATDRLSMAQTPQAWLPATELPDWPLGRAASTLNR